MKKNYLWLILFIVFVLVTLIIKQVIQPFSYRILENIENSIAYGNIGLLVVAAIEATIYEGIKDLPVFVFAYGFTFVYLRNSKILPKVILAIILIFLLYTLNIYIYGSRVELIILLCLTICVTALLVIFHKNRENFLSSIFILIQLNFAFYGLLIITILNGLKVGYRDIVTGIKLSAGFLGGNTILNFIGFSLFIPLILGSVLVTLLTILYSRRLAGEKREKEKERELRLIKTVAEEAQVWQELHYLVHDLKSPLMTMAGLNSLIQLKVQDSQLEKYCDRIAASVENMNEMISEFLHNEKRRFTTIEELLKFVRAHVVVKNANPKVIFKIDENLPKLNINRIRVARALINVIENAIGAVENKENPLMIIRIYNNKNNEISFSIKDNGSGIATEDMHKIWQLGFTTKRDSSGLGMGFVKKVVEDHRGKIEIVSNVDKGTEIIITLPGVKNND